MKNIVAVVQDGKNVIRKMKMNKINLRRFTLRPPQKGYIMDFYYVVIDFYSDLSNADEFEEVLIPYATFEEAADAIEATMDIYDKHNNGEYDTFWVLDTRTTIGFITIRDNSVTRAFRFEIMQGNLGMLRIK